MQMIMLGPPGAGKGSQASNLSETLGIPHISTGDIFRANIKNETSLGLQVKANIDAGNLVPDELTVQIVEDRLKNADCQNGFILDGFPRTLYQAEMLEKILDRHQKKMDVVVNLVCPDEVIIQRLSGRRMCSCGRSYHLTSNPPRVPGKCDADGLDLYIREDDKASTVRSRIETYHNQTEPLVHFYSKEGVLRDIDGTLSIPETTERILKMIGIET